MLSKKNSMVTMVTDEFLENRIIFKNLWPPLDSSDFSDSRNVYFCSLLCKSSQQWDA